MIFFLNDVDEVFQQIEIGAKDDLILYRGGTGHEIEANILLIFREFTVLREAITVNSNVADFLFKCLQADLGTGKNSTTPHQQLHRFIESWIAHGGDETERR